MPRAAALVLLVVALGPAALGGQRPYLLSETDTLTYREITNAEVLLHTPQGEVPIRSEHDATIRFVVTDFSEAQAWYEELRLRSVGPNGDQAPVTTELLGRPYTLELSPTGRVTLLDTPEFPPGVAAITDLTHQFLDFFVAVPAQRPTVGSEWADTLVSTRSGDPTVTQRHHTVRKYTVRGDTTYAGRPALRIDIASTVLLESSQPMQGQPLTVTTHLEGQEEGFVIFDWAGGEMLYRSKVGALSGTFIVEGGPQPVEFAQTMSYTSTIQDVR